MENNKFLGSSDGYGGDGWGSLVTEDENEEEDSSDDGEFIPPYVAHALEKDGREARIKRKLEDSKGGKSYEQRREETEQRLGRAGFSRLNPSEQKAIEAGLQDYLDEQVNSSLSKEILLPEQVFTRLPSLFEFLNETIDDIPDVVSKYEQITDKKEQLKFLLKTSLADKVRLFCSGNFDYSNYDNFMCSLQFQQKIINGTAEVWKKEYDKHKGKYVDVREYLNPSSANSEGILLGLNRAALKAAMIGTPEYGAYKMALDIRRDSGKEIPPDFPRISGSRSKIKDSSIGPWEAIIDEYNKIADRVARRNPSLDEEDLEHKSVREAARIFAKSMEYNRFPNSSYESPFHVAVAWAQLGDAVQKQVQRLRQEDRGLDLNDIGRFIGKSGMNQTRASYEREKHYLEKTLAIFDKKRDLLNNLPDFVRNLNFKEYKRDIESQIERIEYKYRFATDMPELEENTISLAMKNKEAELAPLKYKLNIFKECENKPGILSNFITQWERERILKKKEYLNDTALPDVATLNQQEIQKLENWQEKETTRVNHKYDKLISKTRSEERKAEYERRREGELKALFLDCSKRREYFKHRTLEQLCSDIESRIKIISGRIEKRKSIAEKAIDLHLALMPRYDEDEDEDEDEGASVTESGGHFWIDVDWINKAPFGLIRKAHKLLGSGLSREELIIRAHKEYLDESSFEKWAVDTAYGRLYSKIDEAITHPRRRTNVNLSYDMNGASNFLKMALGEKVASKIQDELISRVNSFFEDLNDPEKNYGGDLENLQFQIKEIGINEVELGDRLELLNNLRKFCMATTAAYVRTARFVMEMYKGRNPNFTDEKMQKIVTRHLDTPSFTIYGKEAGERFIGDNLESDEGEFNSEGILLNFNLPRIFGRFWYLGGEGKLAQPAPKDKVEWGYFYRICMPVVWGKINEASSYGLSLTRINDFSVHDWEKFYYLYDVGPAKHRGYYMNRKRYRFVDNK